MSEANEQDMEVLRAEWHTSETLLAQSQKDNEEKHKMIERYKQYVKELEKLAETACGPSWRTDHGIPPLNTSAPLNTASTPLPKPTPSALRYSTSVSLSSKRSSRLQNRHVSHQIDNRHLDSLREVSESISDSTPTGAMRRLQGKQLVPAVLTKDPIPAAPQRKVDEQGLRLLLEEIELGLARRESAVKGILQEKAKGSWPIPLD